KDSRSWSCENDTFRLPRSGRWKGASRQLLLSHHALGPLPAARAGSFGSSWLKQLGQEPAASGARQSGARSTRQRSYRGPKMPAVRPGYVIWLTRGISMTGGKPRRPLDETAYAKSEPNEGHSKRPGR